MPANNMNRLIRFGLLTVPIAGLLKLIGNLAAFDKVGYGIADSSAAQAVTAISYFMGAFVGNILPVVLLIFGTISIFALLVNKSARPLAVTALVLSILGLALTLPALGVLNYAFPAIGHAYLAGDIKAFGIVSNFFRFPAVLIFFPGLFEPIGALLFSIGIWRSRVLSRWAGVLFAASAFMLAFPLPIHTVRFIGGVVQVIAGAWLVLSLLQKPTIQDVETGNIS